MGPLANADSVGERNATAASALQPARSAEALLEHVAEPLLEVLADYGQRLLFAANGCH
jgi:hypothetical protein